MNSNSGPIPFLRALQGRRKFLQLAGLAVSSRALAFATPVNQLSQSMPSSVPAKPALSDSFPTQPPALAREMVTVSHFDLKRVQQLVEAQPSLARAAWDWGFGDWETCLGAASHMGNRPIAEYLIANGARPSLFSSAMLGHVEVVKAFVSAEPGVQRIRGPHSISLLAHAKAGGEAARPVYEFLLSLGDADAEPQVPLSQGDVDAIVGVYPFGPGENEQILMTADKGSLTWTRKGTMGRPLFHLGGREFYPWGAAAVRIRFKVAGEETLMTVNDPGLVLSVTRKK
ncbi:MAG: hypothetical protein WBQ94_01615 [Terracidiphilus sp.]